ncbi:hypothetical protein Tco_0226700 [Tanacetum coccineum]
MVSAPILTLQSCSGVFRYTVMQSKKERLDFSYVYEVSGGYLASMRLEANVFQMISTRQKVLTEAHSFSHILYHQFIQNDRRFETVTFGGNGMKQRCGLTTFVSKSVWRFPVWKGIDFHGFRYCIVLLLRKYEIDLGDVDTANQFCSFLYLFGRTMVAGMNICAWWSLLQYSWHAASMQHLSSFFVWRNVRATYCKEK